MILSRFIVNGGNRISGEIKLQGAKNSILPVLSASVLAEGNTFLTNCPDLSDVYAAGRILTHLGCSVKKGKNGVLEISNNGITSSFIPDNLMHEMRSSIIFLGPLLSRCGECRLCFPGGCQLGPRPLDIHFSAFRKMGAVINEEHGNIICTVPHGLKGAQIIMPFPSVGATENIILAAVTAEGETELRNAAREPEIFDLIGFLKVCGAKIETSGDSTVFIEGVKKLHGCEYRIMPDRIAAATYMAAAAATDGALRITNTSGLDTASLSVYFEQMGCSVYANKESLYIKSGKHIKSLKSLKTMPYPGFPTDMQAVMMAVLSKAYGTSVFEENIFENRYRHVEALNRMGADIKVYGKIAVVEGVRKLYGADVEATDLRGGAAMIIAALSAEGKTVISNVSHIDRGYENIDSVLLSAGADIERKS